MRDSRFATKTGIRNLHPTKGTHRILNKNENFFDFCA